MNIIFDTNARGTMNNKQLIAFVYYFRLVTETVRQCLAISSAVWSSE